MKDARPSKTAEFVAFQRASERKHPSSARILDDPFARFFLTKTSQAALAAWEHGGKIGELLGWFSLGLTTFVVTRHRYMDDRLLEALADKERAPQRIVVLGAGYDMRAHRHAEAIGGRPFLEVDHPATGKRKTRILEKLEREGRITSPKADRLLMDFQTESLEERLSREGLNGEERVFFIWEGVSMYLTREAVKKTLRTLCKVSVPGSEVVFDCWFLLDQPDLRSASHRIMSNVLLLLGEPLLFGIHPEDIGGFLERCGLELVETVSPAELEERYVRDDRRVYPACYMVWARVAG